MEELLVTLEKEIEQLRKDGKILEVLPLFKEFLDLNKKIYGENSDQVIMILNDSGGLLRYAGRYDEALGNLLEAKSVIEKKYGMNNAEYGTCLLNLAELYRFMNEYEKSESLFKQTIKIYKENNISGFLYASACNNLGLLYQNKGQYEQALELHIKSLGILKELPEHELEYGTTLNNLVEPYKRLGEREKAENCILESLEIFEKIVGKNHSLYSAGINNQAVIYYENKEYEKALGLFEESLIICEKTFGKNSSSYKNLEKNVMLTKSKIEEKI